MEPGARRKIDNSSELTVCLFVMKKRVFSFVLLFVFGPVLGQNHKVIELWPGQVPNERI